MTNVNQHGSSGRDAFLGVGPAVVNSRCPGTVGEDIGAGLRRTSPTWGGQKGGSNNHQPCAPACPMPRTH